MDEKFMNRFAEVPDCKKILIGLKPGNRQKSELAALVDHPEKIEQTIDILIGAGMIVPMSNTDSYRISSDSLNCLDVLSDEGTDEFLSVYEAWHGHGNEFMAEYLTSVAESLILRYAHHENGSQTDLYDLELDSSDLRISSKTLF